MKIRENMLVLHSGIGALAGIIHLHPVNDLVRTVRDDPLMDGQPGADRLGFAHQIPQRHTAQAHPVVLLHHIDERSLRVMLHGRRRA